MSAPDQIPLDLLRELATRIPDPIQPTAFVDLAVFVARSRRSPVPRKPVTKAAASPEPAEPATPPAPAAAQDRPARALRCDAWTSEDHKTLQALKTDGFSWPEIAARMGRTPEACRAQMAILRREQGDDVAGAGATWTEDDMDQLMQARAKGESYAAIAARLGRTVRACEQRAAILRRRAKPTGPQDVAPAPAPARKAEAKGVRPGKQSVRAAPQPISAPAPKVTTPTVPAAAEAQPAPAPASVPPYDAALDADPKQSRVLATLRAALAEQQPGRQIRVLSHLLKLPRETFSPADDLFLAEGLATRRAVAEIADQLGCEPAAVTARWKAMLFSDLTDRNGHILLDGQADLLRALRWLAEREAHPGA